MIKNPFTTLISVLLIIIILFSCGSEKNNQPEHRKEENKKDEVVVRIREAVDASTLNPMNVRDELAGYLSMKLFQSLLSIDYNTLNIVPLLAEDLPNIEQLPNGKLKMNYTIRKEAKWDNGTPITADDIAFSLKILKNPYSSNIGAGNFYNSIEDIQFESGSKSFGIIFSEKYILNEIASGDYSIMPAHTYDTNSYLKNFTVKQLNDPTTVYDSIEIKKLLAFDEEFNAVGYQRNPQFINGSGAYRLKKWTSGQQIVLEKKENWWADDLDSIHTLFQNHADKLVYTIINDNTSALVALKNQELDVMRAIPYPDFENLQNNATFLKSYNLHTPDQIMYHYIGLNNQHPILKNKNVRKAIQHLVDVDKMINMVSKGLAKRTNSPIPLSSPNYNDTLTTIPFQPETSRKLLEKEGWSDSDQDGILDKVKNGIKTDLELDFIYNTDNTFRKYIAIILQEDARKAGVKLNLIPLEWNNYLDRLRNNNFELFYGAKILPPVPRDHKPIFHSTSIINGGNYVGFSNAEADLLIDSIRVELDEEQRKELDWKFQELIHEEVPYIFLFSPKERIAISNKFENANSSALRPGYWEAGFKLKSKATQ